MVKKKKQQTKASSNEDQMKKEKNTEQEPKEQTLFAVKEEENDLMEFEENITLHTEQEALELTKKEEEKRIERLKQADTGVISDGRIYQLMYLEKCVIEASLQDQVRRRAYLDRIEALKQELQGIVKEWESTKKKSLKKITEVRQELEEDYGIFMEHWGYDDELGILQRLPQSMIEKIEQQKAKKPDSAKVTEEPKKEP